MSDDEDDQGFPPVIVIDRGSLEWKCGLAGDEEIGAILNAPGAGQPIAAPLKAAFEELDVEPAEHAILLSEAAGAAADKRDALAEVLFGPQFGVKAFFCAAAPLLPVYHYSVDTGILIDVGEWQTTLLPFHADGYAVLGAAVTVELGGAHLTKWMMGRLLALRKDKPSVSGQ